MPETIPSNVITNMLTLHWTTENYADNDAPTPEIVDINEEDGRQIRYEQLSLGDLAFVKVDIPAMEETPIGSWVYGNRITKFIVEIWTEKDRQRLYDMMGEVRRIVHNQMHSLLEYQRIRFANFNEYTDEHANIWAGRIMIEGVNNAVILEGRNRN